MFYNSNNYLLNQLPENFTRKDVLKLCIQSGYSISKANSFLEAETIKETIERIGRGKYRKIDNKAIQAKELHEGGYSYREIAEQLGISKSQVGNYLSGQGGQAEGQTRE